MKKEDKPRFSTARDDKDFVYKYYPIKGDKEHRMAVPGGRCYKCSKITDAFCDECQRWICENHLTEGEEEGSCFCLDCNK